MCESALIVKCRVLKWDFIEMPFKPNEIIFIKIVCTNIKTTTKLKILHCKNNHVGIACAWVVINIDLSAFFYMYYLIW